MKNVRDKIKEKYREESYSEYRKASDTFDLYCEEQELAQEEERYVNAERTKFSYL